MQRPRQSAHLEELWLLRNYVTGKLRRELDDEIQGLGHHAGGRSDSEPAGEWTPRACTSSVAELAETASA